MFGTGAGSEVMQRIAAPMGWRHGYGAVVVAVRSDSSVAVAPKFQDAKARKAYHNDLAGNVRHLSRHTAKLQASRCVGVD